MEIGGLHVLLWLVQSILSQLCTRVNTTRTHKFILIFNDVFWLVCKYVELARPLFHWFLGPSNRYSIDSKISTICDCSPRTRYLRKIHKKITGLGKMPVKGLIHHSQKWVKDEDFLDWWKNFLRPSSWQAAEFSMDFSIF